MCASTALKYAGAWCQWNHHKMLMIIINKQGKHTTVPYARSRQILFPFALCVFFLFRFFVPYFFLCFLLLLFCSVDYSLFLFWFLFYLSSFFDSIVCEHFPMAYWLSLIAQSKKGDTKTSKMNEKKNKISTNKQSETDYGILQAWSMALCDCK